MKKSTTRITVETVEVLVISRHGGLKPSWCASCGKAVASLGLNEARLTGLSLEVAAVQVEAGRIHLIETAGGPALICLNSLMQISRVAG